MNGKTDYMNFATCSCSNMFFDNFAARVAHSGFFFFTGLYISPEFSSQFFFFNKVITLLFFTGFPFFSVSLSKVYSTDIILN